MAEIRLLAKKRTVLITAFCYGALLLGWVVWGLFAFGYDSMQPETALQIKQAELVDLQPAQEENLWVSTSADPQIIFLSVQANVRQVLLKGEFLTAPGEVDAYFTRRQQDDFSTKNRVWGQMQEDGSYLFQLPPGQVYSLRVDTGSAVGVQLQADEIVLNPTVPFLNYFRISLYSIVIFAFVPALASCFICTIIEMNSIFKNNRPKAEQKRI